MIRYHGYKSQDLSSLKLSCPFVAELKEVTSGYLEKLMKLEFDTYKTKIKYQNIYSAARV